MNRADAAAWLRLFLAVRLERRQWSGLVGAWPDPRRIGAQSVDALCQAGRLAPDTARRLREGAPQEQVEAELALMESRRARLVMCFDPDYPDILRRMTIPPAVFYMAGEYLGCDEAAVAVVGPRLASVHGREAARRIAHGLASAGLTIVSGFAVGIDSAAHVAALDAGGRTLAVLGCGLGVDYPANHAELRARIVEAGRGALLSEFPMTAKPLRHHFPPRNSLIAGLALATVVIEASEKSGALVTAQSALEENRYVFAVPGDITREGTRGSNALLREGAIPLTAAEELLEDLRPQLDPIFQRHGIAQPACWQKPRQALEAETIPPEDEEGMEEQGEDGEALEDEERHGGEGKLESKKTGKSHTARSKNSAAISASAPPAMPASPRNPPASSVDHPEAQRLLRRIAREPADLDTLVNEFVPETLDIGRLSTLLLQLELTGRIRQLPGKIYMAE